MCGFRAVEQGPGLFPVPCFLIGSGEIEQGVDEGGMQLQTAFPGLARLSGVPRKAQGIAKIVVRLSNIASQACRLPIAVEGGHDRALRLLCAAKMHICPIGIWRTLDSIRPQSQLAVPDFTSLAAQNGQNQQQYHTRHRHHPMLTVALQVPQETDRANR